MGLWLEFTLSVWAKTAQSKNLVSIDFGLEMPLGTWQILSKRGTFDPGLTEFPQVKLQEQCDHNQHSI